MGMSQSATPLGGGSSASQKYYDSTIAPTMDSAEAIYKNAMINSAKAKQAQGGGSKAVATSPTASSSGVSKVGS
jgi:hypothetical protein